MNVPTTQKEQGGDTLDSFLGGAFFAYQPTDNGHRSGMDALVLAAMLPSKSKGLLADLGAGAGVAGLAAISRCKKLSVTLVEKNAEMVALATRTAALTENSDLKSRVNVHQADVTLTGLEREGAGLAAESFEHVIMNPPYNDQSAFRSSDDPVRAQAHMMAVGGLDAWVRTGVAILRPKGSFTMIYRTSELGQIIASTRGRLGGLLLVPIHSRENEPSKRILVQGTKGSRAPLSLLPPLVLHQSDGSFTKRAQRVFEGSGLFD